MFFGGTGVTSGRSGQTVELQAGSTQLIPSGTYVLEPGGAQASYISYEVYDAQTGIWRVPGSTPNGPLWVNSDGINHRLANRTGCAVAANVTSGGAGYTSVPTVTINSGGSKWLAVLGPLVSTATVVNGGSNYTYPPIVNINPPPAGGVPATGYATITAGVVTSITITDQGAGYSAGAPLVTLTNDARDTAGSGATATIALTGSGTVAAILCTDFGTPTNISTAGVLPTFTIAGGGYTTIATAVPMMEWTATAYTVTSGGSTLNTTALIQACAVASGTAAYTNPTIQSRSVRTRPCFINATISGGVIVTGGTIYDAGIFPQNPTVFVTCSAITTGSSAISCGITVGGTTDSVVLIPV